MLFRRRRAAAAEVAELDLAACRGVVPLPHADKRLESATASVAIRAALRAGSVRRARPAHAPDFDGQLEAQPGAASQSGQLVEAGA